MYRWAFEDGWYEISIRLKHPQQKGIEEWCQHHNGYFRYRVDADTFDAYIYFRTDEEATMFKLRFGGRYYYDPKNNWTMERIRGFNDSLR